jgi:hypothetical protein
MTRKRRRKTTPFLGTAAATPKTFRPAQPSRSQRDSLAADGTFKRRETHDRCTL